MLENIYPYLAIIIGFVGLIWSADRFVNGAAAIASQFGMSTMLIGLTIVAFGTSAPEILVSINAGLAGAGSLAVGNAIGSNLANIGLVLGVTALIAPLPISKQLLSREALYVLLATIAAGFVLFDLTITWQETSGLFALLLWIFYRLVKQRNDHPSMAEAEEVEELNKTVHVSPSKAWGLFALGLVLLIVSSDILVWGATETAKKLGVSELIIGLTIVAIGTSLPELAASVASALKGHHDIALGNVLGSNMFNLLAVMAVPAIFNDMPLEPLALNRDFASMAILTILLLAMMLIGVKLKQHKPMLARWTGVIMITPYLAYFIVLFNNQTL
jgi:cation:H+ antiporter